MLWLKLTAQGIKITTLSGLGSSNSNLFRKVFNLNTLGWIPAIVTPRVLKTVCSCYCSHRIMWWDQRGYFFLLQFSKWCVFNLSLNTKIPPTGFTSKQVSDKNIWNGNQRANSFSNSQTPPSVWLRKGFQTKQMFKNKSNISNVYNICRGSKMYEIPSTPPLHYITSAQ